MATRPANKASGGGYSAAAAEGAAPSGFGDERRGDRGQHWSERLYKDHKVSEMRKKELRAFLDEQSLVGLSSTPHAISYTSRRYLDGSMPGTSGKYTNFERELPPQYYERRDENGVTHVVQVDPVGQRLYQQGIRQKQERLAAMKVRHLRG